VRKQKELEMEYEAIGKSTDNCFLATQKILMDNNSWKEIKDIKIGDKVCSPFFGLHTPSLDNMSTIHGKYIKIAEITNVTKKILGRRDVFQISDGPCFTEGVKFFKDEEMKDVVKSHKEMLSTPELVKFNAKTMKLEQGTYRVDIVDYPPTTEVAQLTVEGDGCFIVEHFPAHNRSRSGSCLLGTCQILMADMTLKKIHNIRPCDMVLDRHLAPVAVIGVNESILGHRPMHHFSPKGPLFTPGMSFAILFILY
jgi:hypothetical protein